MRILASIPHPRLKITVFKMNERLSVKFESGLYEQTYKFRPGGGADSLDELRALIDETFLEEVEQGLAAMHRRSMAALARRQPEAGEEEFEEIL